MTGHWFWLCITMACMIWYAVVTAFVAVRGAYDIRDMLNRIKTLSEENNTST